jgi:hypothetical protein
LSNDNNFYTTNKVPPTNKPKTTRIKFMYGVEYVVVVDVLLFHIIVPPGGLVHGWRL